MFALQAAMGKGTSSYLSEEPTSGLLVGSAMEDVCEAASKISNKAVGAVKDEFAVALEGIHATLKVHTETLAEHGKRHDKTDEMFMQFMKRSEATEQKLCRNS